ncbi:MAG: tripartite tricarboxylate transporter substrate binding protein [Betaproteobacteria bacterium]|nr:MAG: tripartite tricarboxylate transporter substrate binding protein [Betaproteobacteria bacterium]
MKAFNRRDFLLASASLSALHALPAFAQAWPNKPIRMVVTFAPGGSSDIVARLLQPGLQEKLGQPVIVDNKPGAGGTIGGADVAKSAADGYTFLLSNTAPISISPFMLTQPTYDPIKSFAHIGYIGAVPNVFVVHPSVPAKTVTELVAWIRAQTKPVNFGSGGVGSIGHIVGELFKTEYKLNMEHVPYRGSGPMAADLLGGTLQFAIDTLTQNVPHIKDGKLKGIAVTSRARIGLAPDIPTVGEAGFPKLVAENFLGISAPAGLPNDIAAKVHAALADVLARPDIAKRLEDMGVAMQRKSMAEFGNFVSKQVTDWAPVVKASGAKLG